MIIMGVHGKTPFRFQSKLGRKTTIPHIIKVTRYMATPSHCIIMCWPQISFNTMLSSELVPIVWQVLIKRIWQTLFFCYQCQRLIYVKPFWIIQYWILWKLRRQYCLQSNLISLHNSFQYFVMYSKYFKFLCIFIIVQLTYFLFSILFFMLTPFWYTCIFHPHLIVPKLTFTLNNCFFIVSLHFLYCSKVKFVSK